MTAIATIEPAHLASEAAGRTRAATGLIRLGIRIVDGAWSFEVLANSSPQILEFDALTKTLGLSPRSDELPFVCVVQFEAGGFRFLEPADRAVSWGMPPRRPPFIAAPVLSSDSQVLSLTCVNAVDGPQAVSFDLMPDLSSLPTVLEPVPRIDPTIVNNPDGPPD